PNLASITRVEKLVVESTFRTIPRQQSSFMFLVVFDNLFGQSLEQPQGLATKLFFRWRLVSSASSLFKLFAVPPDANIDGVGDPNVASSFKCGGNLETKENKCNGLLILYQNETNPHYEPLAGVDAVSCGLVPPR